MKVLNIVWQTRLTSDRESRVPTHCGPMVLENPINIAPGKRPRCAPPRGEPSLADCMASLNSDIRVLPAAHSPPAFAHRPQRAFRGFRITRNLRACSTVCDANGYRKDGEQHDSDHRRPRRVPGTRAVSTAPRKTGRVVMLSERRPARSEFCEPTIDGLLRGRTLGVHFQPIIERRRGADGAVHWRIAGAEALVRALGDRSAPMRPDQFLPLIERAGRMRSLFMYVLAESLAAMINWERTHGLRMNVAVNLHAAALLDDSLPGFLTDVLRVAGVAPERLTLELTESAPINDLPHAARTLRQLRRNGVRVALDDFGAGFSTTTRMDWLECDELKIDRALVHGLEHSDEQRCVVESLIILAHTHGMQACAEGVESESTLRLLTAFGCDRVQGYLVARPQPAEAMAGVARKWQARQSPIAVDDDCQLLLPGIASTADFDLVGEFSAAG